MSSARFAVAVLFFFTAAPAVAGFRMSSWIVAHDPNSLTSTQQNASHMTESNPVWYQIHSDGSVTKTYNAENPTWRAAMTGTELMPTIQNIVNGSFDKAIATAVLSTAAIRETHTENIRRIVRDQAFDGIDIDYERLPATAKSNFTEFVRLLASKLHADGKKLSVTIYPQTTGSESWDGPGGQDYAAIGAVADTVKIMIYPYHYNGTVAGPLTPLNWLNDVLTFAKTRIPHHKIIAGLPWYGKEWIGTVADSITFAEAKAIAAANAAVISYSVDGEATFSYSNRTVYFNDAAAYGRKADLIVQNHPSIGGIAHWVNGSEDPAVWTRVEALRSGTGAPPPPPAPRLVPTVSGSTLIAAGAEWIYLDNGSNQGSAWRAIAFDDIAWKSGRAELGYSDGDERTIVSYGPNSADKFVTTYFRYAFNLADPAQYSALALRVKRDDGVVVYVNGAEAWRNNMPAGEPGYRTYAASTVSDESVFVPANVSLQALRSGTNVVAVEIHQADAASSDISFDLELTGTLRQLVAAPTSLGAASSVYNRVDLGWMDASSNETGFVIERAIGAGSFAVAGQVGASVTSWADTTVAASTLYTYRVHAISGTEKSPYSNTASVTTPAAPVVVVPPASGAQTLIGKGATWRFMDNGSNQGTAWRSAAFSDSSWKIGAAEFGYGDGDEKTVVSYGKRSSSKHVTTYFRHSVTVTNPAAFQSLLLRMKRDDGAVVFINGQEVWRSNMPAGAIAYNTVAATTISDADEATFFELSAPASLLQAGINVIAVEVHQADTSSSDLSFDFELIGR